MRLHNPVVLVDGNSLVTRAVKATEKDDLRAGGIATGGVYGSVNHLRGVLAGPLRNKPLGHIFVFFDRGIPLKRRTILPWYKEGRRKRHAEESASERERLTTQLKASRKMFETLGVRCLSFRNREADDCIAAAADYLRAPLMDSCDPAWDARPVIVTGDRDLYQCVARSDARLWDLNRKALITRENFEQSVGIVPDLYLIFKVLTGDPSDSLPGVRGCGAERAKHLVLETLAERPGLAKLSPDSQLDAVVDYVQARESRRKYEDALIDDADRVRRELHGVDLRESFGDRQVLIQALRPGKIDTREFLRLAVKLRLARVAGNPERWLRQFRRPFQPRKARV